MFTSVPAMSSHSLDMEVRDLMTAGVVSVPALASLRRVARALREHRVHAVLVVDKDGTPTGWATVRGLLHNHNRDWELSRAKHAITEPVVIVSPSATAREAMTEMIAHDVSRLLVRQAGPGIAEGVVTDSDLVSLVGR